MRISDQEFNRLTVLKKLREAEPVSRTDLARLSGLNGGTITAIIGDLVARGLVREEKVASAKAGRPRVNLTLNPEGAFVAGATLMGNGRLVVEIVDLRGEMVSTFAEPLVATSRLRDLAGQFADVIGKAIEAGPVAREKISDVGIGLPAILDNRTGIVEFFETFEAGPFPFAAFVENRLRIPVRIDNNISLLARAEHWYGDGTGVENFTLVLLDLGLGAACYERGQLAIGSHGIEAELGHTKIVPEGGRRCHCGGRGCLQVYGSMSGIVEQCHEALGQPMPPFHRIEKSFEEIARRARAGDGEVLAVIARAARYLGVGLANHINMRDPERIIILSNSTELTALVSDGFFEALHENTLPALRDLARVTFKPLDNQGFARGAAAMVLEQLYQSR